jgi:polyisoprenoid-binding protein YceI
MTDANASSIDLRSLTGGVASQWTLDPTASSAEFHVKHFWGLVTVHGHFDTMTGDGHVAVDGTASGEIRIAAESVDTKNKQRDKHLRSDDFFASESHPTITVSATDLKVTDGNELRGPITLSAAGHQQNVVALVQVVAATAESVTLRAEATVDRTAFDMTWSPLKMTQPEAHVVVTALFIRN